MYIIKYCQASKNKEERGVVAEDIADYRYSLDQQEMRTFFTTFISFTYT